MAYAQLGRVDVATELMASITHLRQDDGAVFTGIVYPQLATFPDAERSTYTAAAVVLAADALSRATPASGLFVDDDSLPGLIDIRAAEELERD